MATKAISFTGSEGAQLSARLELPASGHPTAFALFAHCFTCSRNVKAAVNVTRALSALGMGVVRFDFTGLGESEGDFADTNFSSNVEDLVAAGRYMEVEIGAPTILIGHSLGGAAVLRAAAHLPSVRAVCTIGAPSDPAHVLRHIACSTEEIERNGHATVQIGGRPFQVKKQFLDELDAQGMSDAVEGLKRALLIFHSPRDEVVGVENAGRLYDMARHPKSFVSLDEADHLLSDPADSEYVAKVLGAWASRYLEAAAHDEDVETLQGGERTVTRTLSGTFYTEIAVRRHALVADEPASVGGNDAGPTPYDFLLAGLGACTSMTLQMYAGRKGWPLEEAMVRLKHRKLHREDAGRCDEDARMDRIDREVELVGALDDAQKERLMQIADRCPVHRTLDAGLKIETSARNDE